MKKIFLIPFLLMMGISVFAQSKKELLEKIEKLENTNANLLERITDADKALKENDITILKLKNEIKSLKEQIKSENTTSTTPDVSEITKGYLISDSIEKNHTVIRRIFNETVKTNHLDYNSTAEIYDNYIDGKKIGSFTPGDSITFSELIVVDSKKIWGKISTETTSGFIYLNSDGYGGYDWYAGDTHSYVTTISTKDGNFTVRKFTQKAELELDAPIEYQDTPGKSGKIKGTFTFKNKFTPTPVTVTAYTYTSTNEFWIFVENDEGSGWVPSSYASFGRGGPIIYTPEYYLTIYLIEQP